MAEMKLSAAAWSFMGGAPDPLARYEAMRKAGITGIEMVPTEQREIARAAGLKELNFGAPGFSEGVSQWTNHPILLPGIRAAIEEAARLSIPHLIVFSGNRNGVTDEEAMEACAEAFGLLIPFAAEKGVTMIFEMFCTNDHDGYLAIGSRFGIDLARRLNSPNFKLLYDVYHMAQENEDVYADIADNIDFIAHIHVAQPPSRTALVLGGPVDWPGLVQTLEDASYQGYIGLEFRTKGDPIEEIVESIETLTAEAE